MIPVLGDATTQTRQILISHLSNKKGYVFIPWDPLWNLKSCIPFAFRTLRDIASGRERENALWYVWHLQRLTYQRSAYLMEGLPKTDRSKEHWLDIEYWILTCLWTSSGGEYMGPIPIRHNCTGILNRVWEEFKNNFLPFIGKLKDTWHCLPLLCRSLWSH